MIPTQVGKIGRKRDQTRKKDRVVHLQGRAEEDAPIQASSIAEMFHHLDAIKKNKTSLTSLLFLGRFWSY